MNELFKSDLDYWGKTADEIIQEKKNADVPLFDSEKIEFTSNSKQFFRIKKIKELGVFPKKNESFRVVTHNAFNAFDILSHFCEEFEYFDEAYLTSYNFGEDTISSLFELFDKQVFRKLSIVISESIRFRMPKRFYQLKEGIQKRNSNNLRLAGVWNHSKIMLLRKGEDYFIIEGSGNFNSNAYIEQYSFDNSKEVFDFHKNWIDNYVFDNIQLKRHFVI